MNDLKEWVPELEYYTPPKPGKSRINIGDSILRIGEIMLAISLSDFFLRTFPKILQTFFAGAWIGL